MVLDKLKKGFKALAHASKVFITDISGYIEYKNKVYKTKVALLSRFTLKQLEEIAFENNISWVSVDPLTGDKIVARTKNQKIKKIASRLSLDDILRYARRFKVKYKDLIEELDRFRAKIESKKIVTRATNKLNEIVKALTEFKPEPIRDEEELEKQLYQYLKAKFPQLPIERQKVIGRYRADLFIAPCGIEIKVPKSSTHLQRLIGQVQDYSEYFECMITVILDTGKIRNLSSYVEKLKEQGVYPIIIKGSLKQALNTLKHKRKPTKKITSRKRKHQKRRHISKRR